MKAFDIAAGALWEIACKEPSSIAAAVARKAIERVEAIEHAEGRAERVHGADGPRASGMARRGIRKERSQSNVVARARGSDVEAAPRAGSSASSTTIEALEALSHRMQAMAVELQQLTWEVQRMRGARGHIRAEEPS